MDLIALIRSKKQHLDRLANLHGSDGEREAVSFLTNCVPKPKGASMRVLLSALVESGIKTANQSRVREDFSGFFFALTENEIEASTVLGDRHRVVLFNKLTGRTLWTSVPELLQRSRSTTIQVSLQL